MKFDVPTKGLIIRQPWIDLILAGHKDWEMRSAATQVRGPIALIRKGTGLVLGIARLVDVLPALSKLEMQSGFAHHRIPEAELEAAEDAGWIVPWVLSDIQRVEPPVPYRVRPGAVIWVTLDENTRHAVAERLRGMHRKDSAAPIAADYLAREQSMLEETCWVEITAGNLRNNHIYLRSARDLIPEEVIGGPNRDSTAARKLTVEWDGHPPIETDIAGDKMIFRDRTIARRFFEQFDVKPGDRVGIKRLSPYRFSLEPPPAAG